MNASPRDSRGRLGLLGALGTFLLVVLSVRLFWIQIVEGKEHATRGRDQHEERVRLLPHRGRILDRNGTPLAYTAENVTLLVDVTKLDRRERSELAGKLARKLDIPTRDLDRTLQRARSAEVRLNPKSTAVTLAELGELPACVRTENQPKRVYPLGRAAAHVTGYVGVDQEGIDGVEKVWDARLRGQPGWTTYLRVPGGRRFPRDDGRPAESGADLVLTIDSELQAIVSGALESGVQRYSAKSAFAIVLDPKTGDILAMANAPGFDPVDYNRATEFQRRNRIVADAYEPGSTIKAVTASAAIEDGSFRPTTLINCMGGRWMLFGRPITDHEGFGTLPFIDTFVHSSNVAMAQVGMKLGPEKMNHYLRKFGFAQRTGLGLPGESPGLLRQVENWSARTPASVAFGYELRVTPLQMALAYAALANDGVLMRPRLVREVVWPDSQTVEVESPQAVRRVVSPGTARTLLQFMQKTVEEGTGQKAAVDWCRVGGKTGTARKYSDEAKGYVSRHYASFVGVAPLENPCFLCYVVVDEPKGDIYGGSTAAPLFREILDAAGRISHPIVRPDFQIVPSSSPAVAARESAGRGTLPPAAQMPSQVAAAESLQVHGKMAALADTLPDSIDVADVMPALGVAPDLTGQAIRDAFRVAQAAGLQPVVADGQGSVVVRQFPAPGSPITTAHQGRIMLFFGQPSDLAAREKHGDS